MLYGHCIKNVCTSLKLVIELRLIIKEKKIPANSIKRISMDKLNNQPARINSKGFSSSTSSFQLLEAQMGHYVQENQQLLRLD